jgi:hypothetical protein
MMFNPRDPNVPGEYDLARQRVDEVRDAAQRVTMEDGSDDDLARGTLLAGRQTLVVALLAAFGIAAALMALVWLIG